MRSQRSSTRGRRGRRLVTTVAGVVALAGVVASTGAPADAGTEHRRPPEGSGSEDTARYILPPGNYGGIPTTENSRDQLPLYDGLTPLRDQITPADIDAHYLPEDFTPIGATTEEPIDRPGVRVLYDSYGIPHVYGETRYDVAYGAGWATARDRMLLILLGRGPARVAVADVPGIDAFSLITSGQTFVPSAEAEALVTAQVKLIIDTYGAKGWQIIADAQGNADGMNAYMEANGIDQPPATVNDIISTTAFIGSIFGGGGGGEVRNAELLAKLQQGLGTAKGRAVWEDQSESDDPEAPTTIKQRFNYPALTGGPVTGSVPIDAGSVQNRSPFGDAGSSAGETTESAEAAPSASARTAAAPTTSPPGTRRTAVGTAPSARAASPAGEGPVLVPPTDAPPRREASNFLVVSPERSKTHNTLAVMGPQLGYYYPEIVQQMDLHGPGIEAQGVAVPGASMYILIGRTRDYAWSLTSAGHDVNDVYAEQLCNPDGSAPTRGSTHYWYQGRCTPFETFDAGTLNGRALRYPTSVHGPVIGTATSGGKPVALTRKRSTFGRDGLNLAALKDMTDGAAKTPRKFFAAANQFEFTFNWAYASRKETAYFSSGRLPVRPPGLDRRLPTTGDGSKEWTGFLSERQHPHALSGPKGLLLNWNNQSAPGFLHNDGDGYGSVHRVELFDRFPKKVQLTDDVGIMNRAATEDDFSLVWPVIRKVLSHGRPPSTLARDLVRELDRWVADDAPRLDADEDGDYDVAGPTIADGVWWPLYEAVTTPVLGDLAGSLSADSGSFMDKDLRTVLGERVRGKFNVRYCGSGSLDRCQDALWAAVEQTAQALADQQGSTDPSTWRSEAWRNGFSPGLIPDTFRWTNRPTFQQVLELARPRGR